MFLGNRWMVGLGVGQVKLSSIRHVSGRPVAGSFGRKAIFRKDTMSALTSSVKLFDFSQRDLLCAEDSGSTYAIIWWLPSLNHSCFPRNSVSHVESEKTSTPHVFHFKCQCHMCMRIICMNHMQLTKCRQIIKWVHIISYHITTMFVTFALHTWKASSLLG